MPSERNWETRRLSKRPGMMEDDTVGMSREESPIKKWAIATAMISGGVLAYKSGLLKQGVKQFMEYADGHQPYIKEARRAAQDWAYKKHIVEETAETYRHSIIRQKVNLKSAVANKYYRQRVIHNTMDDVKTLGRMVQEQQAKVTAETAKTAQRKLRNTDIINWSTEIGITTQKELGALGQGYARQQMKNTMVERLLETQTQTTKEATTQLKRTGYRTLTMGDLFELDSRNRVRLQTKYRNKYDLAMDDRLDKRGSKFAELINHIMSAEVKVGNDYKKLYETDKWKNIKVDRNMFIDETGKIIDTRNAASEMNSFIQSMANNFQIPVIGMNPLRLFGVDTQKHHQTKFGLLGQNTINPMITKGVGHDATIGNVFGNKPLFFADGNVYRFEEGAKTATLVDKGFKFYKMKGFDKRRHGLPTELHNLHILSKLDYYDYEEYTSADGFIKNAWGKIGRGLDLGRQDRHGAGVEFNEGFQKYFQPDYYADWAAKHVGGRIQTAKTVTRERFTIDGKPNIMNLYGTTPEEVRMFVGIRKGYKIKDAWSKNSDVTWGQYGRQFFTGRHTDETGKMVLDQDVTATTLAIFNTINRASQSLAPLGLDLSNASKKNVIDLTANLVLKRFLPVYGAYQGYEYLNYLFESDRDEDGNPNNLSKMGANLIKNVDLGYHQFKDAIGVARLAKSIAPLLPGAEQLPISAPLDLASTAEERLDWYENGMVAVRKGRWWGMGNTPFSGGKIEYWQPNWYRRVQADVKFSDSMYGSRKEYFRNAWFSTPTSPLAPIRHFITDPYHYDKKHYLDRPYLVTSGAFSQVPFFGPVLDSTIGTVIKPRKKMHLDYWNAGGVSGISRESSDLNLATAKGVATGVLGMGNGSPGFIASENENEQLISYVTPSGSVNVVGVPGEENLRFLNRGLKSSSLKRLTTVNQRVALETATPDRPNVSPQAPLMPNHGLLSATETFDQVANLQGMIGFLTKGFVTGDLDVNRQVLESSDYAYSFNRQFWDANIGGSGGELMEIFRRFIPQRRKDVEWMNPIRNTQPSWMPGSDYFTDFKHGDPYTKVAKGEMRLAGEGYERLWGIQAPTLNIGSSHLGKSKSDMIKHFLKQDQDIDDGLRDILDTGNKIHNEIEKQLMESGVAIDVEGEIKDRENGILGYYDVMMNDPTSSNGIAFMDIKTVGNKGFQEIKETGVAKHANQAQVNYYLWATGNTQSNGYIYYINRDNPEERQVIKFKFDKKMLDESFKNLNEARKEVLKGLHDGTIGRGELYGHVDRLRILADVAPYSKEYQEQKRLVSRLDLSEAERQEVSEINKRVIAQKEPLRIYDYRFKTANVKSETVTIKKVLDRNTFIVKEHPNNPIRLAGVRVVEAENQEGVTSDELLAKYISKGKKVRIFYDADPINQISNDTLKTIRASVVSNGFNVNRKMLEEGVAKEDEDDYSPAAVHARFNAVQRAVGSTWERFAHLHTPIHTKLLQVRSGYESYKRREVYGKDFQRWENPISDFLMPLINENIERGPIAGILGGAFFGSLFGRGKYGAMIGGTLGVSSYVVGKTNQKLYELKTGRKWIPKVRRQERELEEYMDMLEFVKNRKLYEQYRQKALKEDQFDVERYLKSQQYKGRQNKKEIRSLEDEKKKIKLEGSGSRWKIPILNRSNDESDDERISSITAQINHIKNQRKIHSLPANALRAIHYYTESEKTMYGYDSGEPLQNLLGALPKTERQYMKYFMEAPEEERDKILSIAPDYMKRALQSMWGYEVDSKKDIVEYFTQHVLPDEDWVGWQENVSLDDVKVKLIKKAGLDFSEFDVWDDQVEAANQAGSIPLPKMNHQENPHIVAQKLKGILSKQGLQDIQVEVKYSSRGSKVEMNIQEDVHSKIQQALREQEI